jgi:hypothetical protein
MNGRDIGSLAIVFQTDQNFFSRKDTKSQSESKPALLFSFAALRLE